MGRILLTRGLSRLLVSLVLPVALPTRRSLAVKASGGHWCPSDGELSGVKRGGVCLHGAMGLMDRRAFSAAAGRTGRPVPPSGCTPGS